MIRVWGKIIVRHKILTDHVASHSGESDPAAIAECLQALCEKLDIPRPVVISKHERELLGFGFTRFLPSDFVERVSFDRFEVEILADNKKDGASKERPDE